MKIAIASDHAGFRLKEILKAHLQKFELVDLGTSSDESVDYPEFAKSAAKAVQRGAAERGILVCGSGIGMCIVANRFKGIRAVVLHDEFDAEMSRKHNDANVACLSARSGSNESAIKLIDIWLATKFEGGRHEKRVKKIDEA